MDSFCYNLAIRQRKCQNGIALTTDNVYTNIDNDSEFMLAYGYILKIVSKNSNSVTIEIENPDLLNTVKFNIPVDSFKSFDLPLYNGTFIVLIGVIQDNCPCPNILR